MVFTILSPLRSGWWRLAVLSVVGLVSSQSFTSTPANFRGFHILPNGAVDTITCSDSATFFMSSTYGACCYPDQRCNFATECVGGTASRIFGGTSTCDSEFPDCFTMTVYASYPSASDSWLVRGCATNWKAFTVYRAIVTATSASTTSTMSASPSSAPSAATATTTGSAPTNTGDAQPQAAASQAWIAGAVIGPVIAVALIGFLAFWLGTRRGRGKTTPTVLAPTSEMAPSMMGPGTGYNDQTSYRPSAYHSGFAGSSPMAAEGVPFMAQQDPALPHTPSPPILQPGYMQSMQPAHPPGQYQYQYQHGGAHPGQPYQQGPENTPELADEPLHRR
ncbi:hypothetical protein B0T25DRAFT_362603 [Lasiosphaeria hispida]|uniref:Mid2 domain-containing protein n=1 Tax=Lasiosphaeria hispida TaxID=260671 RepID=A0AAJ0H519_9PEZI|nr:hypothetical protein B0T25DRAFT_362603 [Lasiosphaeria hispida]